MRKAFLFVILTVFVVSIAFAQTRPRTVVPTGKFKIEGSVVVEYQANTENGNFSLDVFREENKGVFLKKQINDENFGEATSSVCPGGKKRIYLVRQTKNQVFTTAEATDFIKKSEGEIPTLIWALLLQEQYGVVWQQQTAIITDQTVAGKNGLILVPSISPEGHVSLVSPQYPWEGHDFIFMVDEPTSENAEANNATATATVSID